MALFGRAAPAPMSAPARGGWSPLTWLLIVGVLLVVGWLALGHGQLPSLPAAGDTVTVTVPNQPSVTLPKPDQGTMAELQVVQAGASFSSWAKVLVLTALRLLIYFGLIVLALGLALWKTHVFRSVGQAVMTTAGIGLALCIGFAVGITYILPILVGLAFGGA